MYFIYGNKLSFLERGCLLLGGWRVRYVIYPSLYDMNIRMREVENQRNLNKKTGLRDMDDLEMESVDGMQHS